MSPSDDAKKDLEFRERLTAYLDDRMSPREAREFLAWLESHPDAWKQAEESRRVWALLAAYRDEAVPEGFAERVLARTASAGGTVSGREPVASADGRPALRLLAGGRVRALAVAAGLVAALGVGVLWGRLGSNDGAPSEAPDSAAALAAVPPALLERLDGDDLVQIASLSDEEFDRLLLTADSQDVASGENGKPHGG